ncbi:MAG: type II toxin-antitoxin system VapC family toxin [Leptolyngbyaceae cyanobacterium SM1_3_5]|nr:type II toxin-antitoxin system VapC family toxin [Leptolyngbyaceae cyanobacterium SM1_3_5]
MTLRCVLDTNICIKLFIADPLTPKVNQLFDHLSDRSAEFFVPDLLFIECTNTLLKYVRANLYTAEQVQADLTDLQALRFQVTSTRSLMIEAVQIGVDYGITAYDACYVALSQRVNAPLLTLDERLVNSLASSGFDVQLFTDFTVPPLPT